MTPHMDNRTKGNLIERFAVKVGAIGIALWVASYAGIAVTDLFERINGALQGAL